MGAGRMKRITNQNGVEGVVLDEDEMHVVVLARMGMGQILYEKAVGVYTDIEEAREAANIIISKDDGNGAHVDTVPIGELKDYE